jgi:fluoride exporter
MGAIGAVVLGGALGSLARHGVNVAFAYIFGRSVPYATAAVNILGSLAIGILAGLLASGRLAMTPNARSFVFVGLLGGFTTFSSFMLDTLTLTHGADNALGISNVVGQVGIGLIAVYAGYYFVTN